MLKHYFFPQFNLLSIKLTRESQIEILDLLDKSIQNGVAIFQKCKTLRNIWSTFLLSVGNESNEERQTFREHVIRNDEVMMSKLSKLNLHIFKTCDLTSTSNATKNSLLTLSCETSLKSLAIRCLYFYKHSKNSSENKEIYQLKRIVQKEIMSFDASTCRIQYAMILFMKADYALTLAIVNQMLSRIPPFGLYRSSSSIRSGKECRNLYKDKFLYSDPISTQRARKAWLFDVYFKKSDMTAVPFAIQIELSFCDDALGLSPFACAHYLLFLCYHELRQYDRRDSALRQLVDSTNNPEQLSDIPHSSFNIAGFCLLLARQKSEARDMFTTSYVLTEWNPPHNKYNSAKWYLEHFF